MYVWSATRLPATAVAWRTEGAVSSLTAVVKATFSLAIGEAALAEVQEPIVSDDDATARAPSDLAPFKTRADVLVVGSSFPSRTSMPCQARLALASIDAGVEVRPGGAARALAALGPRPTDPARGLGRWNIAPPAQQIDALPDEIQITLEHLSPLAPLVRVSLPPLHFSVYADGGGISGSHPMRADTLWIDTDRQIACITYRATFSRRDDSELRATILTDHPALQQEPDALALLELDDPSADDDDLPMETGLVSIPSEISLARDGLPFRPAAAASPLAPPLARSPQSRATIPSFDDDAPATIPPPGPPPGDGLLPGDDDAPATIPPPALPPISLRAPLYAPPLLPPPAPVASPPARLHPPPVPVRVAPPQVRPQAQPQPVGPPDLASLSSLEASTAYPSGSVAHPPRRFDATPAPTRLAHDAGAVLDGLVAASDAAAHSPRGSGRRRRLRGEEVERPRPTSNDICDLLWSEAALALRVRRMVEWAPAVRDHTRERGWLGAEESVEEAQEASDRRVVMRALARVTPAEVSTLPRLLAESTDDDGFVARPLLVVAGELSLPPDPHDVLKATMELAAPYAKGEAADKPGSPTGRLRAALDAAGEQIRGPGVAASIIEAPLTRIRQAFAGLGRGLPADYLEATVQQTMVEERRHRTRELFGGPHVWCQIQAGTGTPTTVYLAEDAAKLLPLSSRLRVRAIAEPHPVQNRADGEGPVLRALAIARVIAQRPR